MGEVSRKKSSAPSARAIMPAARATSRIERLTYVRDAPAGDVATGVANDVPIAVPHNLARVNFEVLGAWWMK
jgi:hypothetical protein